MVPWRSPCETPEQQQDSSPRQAKCPYAKLPKASNGSKLRAQGMQNTSQQKCFPLPLESIKHVLQNSSRIPRTMPTRCLRNVLTAELTSIAFGGPLPKQPNSSKWHAQHQEWNLTWNVQHQNYRPKPLAEHFRNSRAAVARRAFGKNLDSSKLLGALPLSKSKGSADIIYIYIHKYI